MTNYLVAVLKLSALYLFLSLLPLIAAEKLSWKLLAQGNLVKNSYPLKLKELAGKEVTIAGYMVLIEGEPEKPRQFLLVPVAGMCIHLPPPPANQMLLVQLSKTAKSGFYWGAIEVTGILELAAAKSPFGKAGYTIREAKMRNLENF